MRRRMPRSATYAIGVLLFISAVNTFDGAVLPTVAASVQGEFHLDDAALGLLGSALFIMIILGAAPSALLADRHSRRLVLGTAVAIFSALTMLSGLAANFWQLLATRAGVGLGTVGTLPASFSLVGDYFPKSSRGRALAVLGLGTPLGLAAGFILAGAVAGRFGWRSAFFMAALPGLVCAVLAFTLREPPRGGAEPRGPRLQSAHDAGLAGFASLLRIPTLVIIVLAASTALLTIGAIIAWVPVYLGRTFGVGMATAGALTGLPLLLATPLGSLLGGWLVDRLSRRRPLAHLQVSMIALVSAAVGAALMLTAGSIPLFVAGFAITAFGISCYNPALQALMQNIVMPSLRGSAMAMVGLAGNVCQALAPLLVGLLSDRLHSLQLAMLLVMPSSLLLAAVVVSFGLRTALRDMAAMEEGWAARTTETAEREPEAVPVVAG